MKVYGLLSFQHSSKELDWAVKVRKKVFILSLNYIYRPFLKVCDFLFLQV
jgi:hypothetical protein